ncbi:hypothetical protein [Brevundimonas goettingensis]|uniref:DUF4019 domain-containing protein n=1 Tax=Brevundimonas goettingensis TaxID=2774190 RepID=A0A975C1C4_9CAUL|nr:hypothetical protein [Brevundimonas goettingensis]QTC92011.1 hypothetical protein IFJ75_03590 [Brevundimonas goettingensis]
MFNYRSAAVAVCAAMAVSGCGVAPAMKPNVERDAEADALLADISAGNADAVLARMSSENSPGQIRAQLPVLKTLVPTGAVPAGTTGGWRANVGTAGSTYELNRIYEYPDRTLALAVLFKKEGEAWKVFRFNLNVTLKEGATPPALPAPGEEKSSEEKAPEPLVIPVEPKPKPNAA